MRCCAKYHYRSSGIFQAVAWEAFGDEATGTMLIQEVFRSEDDADAYEQHMESNGFIARAYDLFTSARVLTLDPIAKTDLDRNRSTAVVSPPVAYLRLPSGRLGSSSGNSCG